MNERDCPLAWPFVSAEVLASGSVLDGSPIAAELLLLLGSSRVLPSLVVSLCRCISNRACVHHTSLDYLVYLVYHDLNGSQQHKD